VTIATPHATHAEYAASALKAGKHVWCEKPLALTDEELDGVEAAWRASGKVLFVGLNRRWAPHVRAVRAGLAGAPAVVNYRVSAGRIPDGHWYGDRRQGGRLLGEVCHFIDACAALVDSDVVSVQALGGGTDELLLAEDLVISLCHRNGSLSTIAYASAGSANTSKERIEILGRGHTWLIDDFKILMYDGKEASGAQDKGQRAAVAAFKAAVDGAADETSSLLASSRATLAAAAALLS
jgi:predicted dehydrogenase